MNFLRECWGWEGGNLLPLQNSFTSDGWSSFLQPRCSSLGHNQENPCYILNASRCTVSEVKQKPHQTTYPNSCAAPREVKKWLWPGECSSQTLLGSLGASLPSSESLKNCCWWGRAGQSLSQSLIASQGSASQFTSCSGQGFDWNADLGLDSFARATNRASWVWWESKLYRIILRFAWIIAIFQPEVKSDRISSRKVHYYYNLPKQYILDKGCYSF